MTRVSTYSLQQTTLANSLRVQNNIFDTQKQISSGEKSDTYAGLSGQVELLASVTNRLNKSSQYIKNNQLTISRLDSTNQAISQLIDVASAAKNSILQRRNGVGIEGAAYEQQVVAYFRTAASQLNTNVDGRYLFSGARTDSKPINEEEFPVPVELGVLDSGYYNGSTDDISVRIEDNYAIDYNVRADSPAVQRLMAAFALVKEGNIQNDDELLKDAYDMMQSATEGLIELQAQIGTTQGVINGANERHDTQSVYWKGLREDVVNADVVALSAKLAVDNVTLQASFQSFSKINSLRLVDFLR